MQKTGSNYLNTRSGKQITFDGATNIYDIEDIAHSLSQLCRFNGHTPTHYSVAEHCVLMARHLMPIGYNVALEALLHDAHEAYTGDMTTTLKAMLPDFRLIEHRMACDIMEVFGVKVEIQEDSEGIRLYIPSDPVYELDKRICKHEAGSMDMGFGSVDRDLPRVQMWSADRAKSEYMKTYEQIVEQIS